MKGWIRRRVLRLAVVTPVLFAVAGGIAYATIPDSGKVYRACMLNNIGTIRLIDPTLPSTNLMSKCSSLETPLSWNATGQQGLQGIQGATGPAGADGKNGIDGKNGLDGKNGAPGTNGTNGVSPNVTSLAPGDAHCQTGGASITDANGTTAYVCNGQKGVDGTNATPFSGTFTSPNNLYSINVSDNGCTHLP